MAKKVKVKIPNKNIFPTSQNDKENSVSSTNENAYKSEAEGTTLNIGNVKIPVCNPSFRKYLLKIPVFLIVPVIYVISGKLTHLWHPLWMMFFFIPVYYQFAIAVGTKTFKGFLLNLPIIPVAVLVFLILGFALRLWSVAWVLFLLIPAYYWFVGFMKKY